MRYFLLLLVLLVGCNSKPIIPELGPVAESVDKTVTADLVPQFWQGVPVAPPFFELIDEGVATPDDDTTYLLAQGFGGEAPDWHRGHFSLEDAPADLDVLTEIKVRVRGKWQQRISPTPYAILCDFYIDAGATFIGSVLLDLTAQTEGVWNTYGFASLTGLALSKAQADDLSVILNGVRPDFPDKNAKVWLSTFDFRYVYATVPIPFVQERCLSGDFATERTAEAEFRVGSAVPGEFSTHIVILGSVPINDVLGGAAQSSAPPVVVAPAATSDAVVERCISGGFQSVYAVAAEFRTVQAFTVSVPEC